MYLPIDDPIIIVKVFANQMYRRVCIVIIGKVRNARSSFRVRGYRYRFRYDLRSRFRCRSIMIIMYIVFSII